MDTLNVEVGEISLRAGIGEDLPEHGGSVESVAVPERPAWVEQDLGSPRGEGVRIGVIDSGWDRELSDPRIAHGVGLVDPQDELELLRSDDDHDRIGHGTACGDLILQIAPKAEIVPIRVFGRRLETSPPLLQVALAWAVERRLHVVNMSLGTLLPEARDPLYVACELARRDGIIVVAAGHAQKRGSFPAAFDNVIGVAAGEFDSPFHYRYSPGEVLECVARGFDQRARTKGGCVVPHGGTSFAAPNITGIVALLRERYPRADPARLRALLYRYAVSVGGPGTAESLRNTGESPRP